MNCKSIFDCTKLTAKWLIKSWSHNTGQRNSSFSAMRVRALQEGSDEEVSFSGRQKAERGQSLYLRLTNINVKIRRHI